MDNYHNSLGYVLKKNLNISTDLKHSSSQAGELNKTYFYDHIPHSSNPPRFAHKDTNKDKLGNLELFKSFET